MARQTVLHEGFFVPNAATVSNPRMAEPDKVDFSTAANSRWGVVEGCNVTCSTTTVHVDVGTIVVNGAMKPVAETTITIPGGDANDRFDLIAVNDGGNVIILSGTPAVDPVFPDVPLTATILAAVFCATTGPYDDNVIDKRKFLPKSLLTKVAATIPLVQNRNGAGDYFKMTGDGTMLWANGVVSAAIDADALHVSKKLITEGFTASTIATGLLAASGLVTGSNLSQTVPRPASAPIGAIYQDPANGVPSYYDGAAWQSISSADVLLPPGTVVTSILLPNHMPGWVPLDGNPIPEASAPRLFTIAELSPFITGTAGNRTMNLPSSINRVLMGGQTAFATGGKDKVTLTAGQVPRHKHNVKTVIAGGGPVSGKTAPGGRHIHTVSGGQHFHLISDPGHRHHGGDYPFGSFIALAWGGNNKIDALFNDRNHTYSVEACEWVAPETTGITRTEMSDSHPHDISEASPIEHDHAILVDPQPAHEHPTTEDFFGGTDAIDITPPFITLFVYIRK